MTIIVHGGTSFSSSFDDFSSGNSSNLEQSFLNRPVWVLLELIQLLVFLEFLLLLVLLERLQLLHVVPAFFVLQSLGFSLPPRHPHLILWLRHVTNSP